jgi:hypothetical protein
MVLPFSNNEILGKLNNHTNHPFSYLWSRDKNLDEVFEDYHDDIIILSVCVCVHGKCSYLVSLLLTTISLLTHSEKYFSGDRPLSQS